MSESKKEIYDLLPQNRYPATLLISEGSSVELVQQMIVNAGLKYPIIAKPDIGLRGAAVQKIENEQQLVGYCERANFDFLLQDLIPYPNEVGIFYVRFPESATGKITGIVSKEFLTVIGDGKSTISDLVKANPRSELQLVNLRKVYGSRMSDIPFFGETLKLVPFGNHARGAKFLDWSDRNSCELEAVIDAIAVKIPGFYFGRFDIMYQSWEKLLIGEEFQIVELNGSGSEPTHIYDPKHSIFFAWKELARHIILMHRIAQSNKRRGVKFLTRREGMLQYKLHLAQSRKISTF